MNNDLMSITETAKFMNEADFKYKGKTVVRRTVRTMIDKNKFKSAIMIRGVWYVKKKEVKEACEKTGLDYV